MTENLSGYRLRYTNDLDNNTTSRLDSIYQRYWKEYVAKEEANIHKLFGMNLIEEEAVKEPFMYNTVSYPCKFIDDIIPYEETLKEPEKSDLDECNCGGPKNHVPGGVFCRKHN